MMGGGGGASMPAALPCPPRLRMGGNQVLRGVLVLEVLPLGVAVDQPVERLEVRRRRDEGRPQALDLTLPL